ncbi:hypothetical protein OUZ56_011379 [Daphnia magna]|uniref:Uncharacterized protein n=1 Tax=Daphnia magna TaxID=35525 RepID=A0ABQ9YZY9_9CRUS|nr:hypothetical protein OUZ56_011379 [Daphnia magna]
MCSVAVNLIVSSGFVESLSHSTVLSLRRESRPCREVHNSILEAHNPLNSSSVPATSTVDNEFTSWLGDDKGEEKEVFRLELEVEAGELRGVWFGLGVGIRNGEGDWRLCCMLRMIGGDIWWEARELCVVDRVKLLEIKEFLVDGRERVGECGKFVESKGLEENIDELGVCPLMACPSSMTLHALHFHFLLVDKPCSRA